ncbi:hypothetical protein GCM10020256_26790 [Streptomyces thermocoprophilus]
MVDNRIIAGRGTCHAYTPTVFQPDSAPHADNPLATGAFPPTFFPETSSRTREHSAHGSPDTRGEHHEQLDQLHGHLPQDPRREERQGGQTAVEYLGIIAVVVAIVLAITGTDIGQTIFNAITDKINEVIGNG